MDAHMWWNGLIFQDSDWSTDNNQSTQATAANVNKRHVTPPTVPKASSKSDSMNNLLSDETDVKSNSKLKSSDKQSLFHDNDDDEDIFSAAVTSQEKAKPKAKPTPAVPQSTAAKSAAGLFAGQGDDSSSDDDIFKTAATSANKKVACLSLSY